MTQTDTEMTDNEPVLLTARQVRRRYGDVADMTLWRWIRDGVLPPPDRVINGRRYWWSTTLAAHDREAA